MELFIRFIGYFEEVPDWVPLILCPALVVAAAAFMTGLGGRKAYPAVAVVAGAAGFCFVCVKTELSVAFIYLGLFAALCTLFGFLFLIPCPLKKRKEGRGGRSKADKMYEKFREELSEEPFTAENAKKPPKVCCFEPSPAATAEESGTQLSHVETLLTKLRSAKLNASDLLEVDALSRTIDRYRGKPLAAEELRSLNDCLATVLKLTAKYRL